MINPKVMQAFLATSFFIGTIFVGAWFTQTHTSDQSALPPAIRKALLNRFPSARVKKWTREKEGKIYIYDVEFIQKQRKYEADIAENGVILNWERSISLEELPKPVRRSLLRELPHAAIRSVMAIMEVGKEKEKLMGYEITVETQGQGMVEITIAPNGTILEKSPAAP